MINAGDLSYCILESLESLDWELKGEGTISFRPHLPQIKFLSGSFGENEGTMDHGSSAIDFHCSYQDLIHFLPISVLLYINFEQLSVVGFEKII